MKRESKLLIERGTNSLLNGIEHFNRPFDRGRVEAVLIFLDHAFEMLLKAAITERGGRIRDVRANQTHSFDKCIRIGLTEGEIKFLTDEQAITLRALNGLRDAAQHYIVSVSEGQLYVISQASVTLFRDILRNVFSLSLTDYLPERVLPISTRPPMDISAIFDCDVDEIRRLLLPGLRNLSAVGAKLRSLSILEYAVNGSNLQPTPREVRDLMRSLKEGRDWREIFPGVASIQTTSDGSGPQLSLRITKKDGIAITVVKGGEEPSGNIAIKRVAETDFYNLSLQALSEKIGVGRNRLLEVIRHLRMKDNVECFKSFRIGKVEHKMYSPRALQMLREQLPQLDVEEIWRNRRN
jgi:hypothetical protein